MRNPNLGSSLTHIDRLMTFSDVHCKTRDVSSSFPHNIQSRILSIHLLPHSITQNVGKENAFIMNYVHRPKAQASSSSDAPQNRQLLPSFSSSHPSAETAWSDTRRSGIILVPLIQAPPSQRCFFFTTLFFSLFKSFLSTSILLPKKISLLIFLRAIDRSPDRLYP